LGRRQGGWDAHPFCGDWHEALPPTWFRLWADNRLVYERVVQHANPFRLPHLSRHLGFEIKVERGESPQQGMLTLIQIASSISALMEG
jgi:hypothetical protein